MGISAFDLFDYPGSMYRRSKGHLISYFSRDVALSLEPWCYDAVGTEEALESFCNVLINVLL